MIIMSRKIRRLLTESCGSVGIFALIGLLILGLLGSGLITLTNANIRSAASYSDGLAAQYAAEAGAKRAVVELMKDITWRPATSDFQNASTTSYSGQYKITITPPPAGGSDYKITAVGKFNKSTRTVVLVARANAGNDVFNKFVIFSNGKMAIDNNPTITGDIKDVGSNSSILINSSSELIAGTAYTPNVPTFDQWSWNKNAANKWQYANPAGSLAVSLPPMPTMPAFSASGSALPTTSGSTLSGNYYSSKTCTLAATNLIVPEGKTATVYINGDLQLTSQGQSASITGNGNIILYVNGNVILDNASSIQTSAAGQIKIYSQGKVQLTNSSSIKGGNITIQANQSIDLNSYSSINNDSNYSEAATQIYTNGDFQLTNYSSINSGNVTLQANGKINLNSSSSINNNPSYADAISQIYSNGDIQTTNGFILGGKAGLFETMGAFNLNSNTVASNAIFIAGSGASQVTNNAKIGGIYTNGTLNINSSPLIEHNNEIIQALGSILLSGGSGSNNLTVISYSDH